MSGFKNETINIAFVTGMSNAIITHLINCSKRMKLDCINNSDYLENNENKITRKLHGMYLNKERIYPLAYELESSENYDAATNQYTGRVDLKVTSCDYFRDPKAYFIVECKRISNTLARLYVDEGVARFFYPITNPKYSSFYKRNIMFAYVVQAIDIASTTNEIEMLQLQSCLLKGVNSSKFTLLYKLDLEHYVYECEYESSHTGKIILSHLFFNFSDVIQKH